MTSQTTDGVNELVVHLVDKFYEDDREAGDPPFGNLGAESVAQFQRKAHRSLEALGVVLMRGKPFSTIVGKLFLDALGESRLGTLDD